MDNPTGHVYWQAGNQYDIVKMTNKELIGQIDTITRLELHEDVTLRAIVMELKKRIDNSLKEVK